MSDIVERLRWWDRYFNDPAPDKFADPHPLCRANPTGFDETLIETDMAAHSLMFNWIGDMPDRNQVMAIPGVHWHDYGKSPRPGRKIGHATLTAGSMETLKTNALRLAQIAGGEFPSLLRTLFE